MSFVVLSSYGFYRTAKRTKYHEAMQQPLLNTHSLHVFKIGNFRTRRFVAAYMALQMAGASGGIDGSPMPVGLSVLGTK